MICLSIAGKNISELLLALTTVEGLRKEQRLGSSPLLIEVRLDAGSFTTKEVGELFANQTNLVATCRPGRFSSSQRESLLTAAITAGAAFVDLELDAPQSLRQAVLAATRDGCCKVIISHHDLNLTPSLHELIILTQRCFSAGGDVAKIACYVRKPADAARLLSLYDDSMDPSWSGKLVVVGMGELGKVTRVAAPLLGSPFSYASLSPGKETAEGQLSYQTLCSLLKMLRENPLNG